MASVGSKVVGLVIWDFTDGGLTALKWAHEHLKRPDKKGFNYKMCLIHIIQVANQTPIEVILNKGKPIVWDRIELLIKRDGGNNGGNTNDQLVDNFQQLGRDFDKILSLRRFQGEHFQDTLQFAINELSGLDMLILGCAAADGRSPTMPQIGLPLLSRCSTIVLAGIHPAPSGPGPRLPLAEATSATANDGSRPVNNASTAASPIEETNEASTS